MNYHELNRNLWWLFLCSQNMHPWHFFYSQAQQGFHLFRFSLEDLLSISWFKSNDKITREPFKILNFRVCLNFNFHYKLDQRSGLNLPKRLFFYRFCFRVKLLKTFHVSFFIFGFFEENSRAQQNFLFSFRCSV